jgi:hypothetical protein
MKATPKFRWAADVCAFVLMFGLSLLLGMCAVVTLINFIFRALGVIIWGVILYAMLH